MKVIISKEMGLMLYWCEGDKSVETCKIGLTTSDPEMLNYFISWLINYYGIRKSKIKLRLHLWEGSNEEIAKKYFLYFKKNMVLINDKYIFAASKFKLKYVKKCLSYADCLGYIIALKNDMKFLTGDKEFENLENVEFIKN